jgi:hypothetical protein
MAGIDSPGYLLESQTNRRQDMRRKVNHVYVRAHEDLSYVWTDKGPGWAMMVYNIPVVFRRTCYGFWVMSDAIIGSYLGTGASMDMLAHRFRMVVRRRGLATMWDDIAEHRYCTGSMATANTEAIDKLI